jgi:2,3-bisphosphoglycerate-dependent phosphoglycerate mutase
MVKLILMRHGQSQWNLANLFTGWVDVPLTLKGIEEALEGGRQIKDEPIDLIFTSSLIRAQMTAMLAMSVHTSGFVPLILHPEDKRLDEWGHIYNAKAQSQTVPVIRAWELNERMYGELQGSHKEEMVKKYGAEQVHTWRRSFDVPPPNGESLQMTAARTLPYFEKTIVPYLKQGKNIFIAAHGNSLRSIMMKLDGLTNEQVVKLELDTGVPIIYDFHNGKYIKQKK